MLFQATRIRVMRGLEKISLESFEAHGMSSRLMVSMLAHGLVGLLFLLFLQEQPMPLPKEESVSIAIMFEHGINPPDARIGTHPSALPSVPQSGVALDVNLGLRPSWASSDNSMLSAPQVNVPAMIALPRLRQHSVSSSSSMMRHSSPGLSSREHSAPHVQELATGLSLSLPSQSGTKSGNPSESTLAIQHISGPVLNSEWYKQLDKWWLEHRYYPDAAVNALDHGVVKIEIMVDPTGRVQRVDVNTGSGSMWLDAGALSVFRNAQLAPFPPGTDGGGNAKIRLTIHYFLS
jgi:TonB family protein